MLRNNYFNSATLPCHPGRLSCVGRQTDRQTGHVLHVAYPRSSRFVLFIEKAQLQITFVWFLVSYLAKDYSLLVYLICSYHKNYLQNVIPCNDHFAAKKLMQNLAKIGQIVQNLETGTDRQTQAANGDSMTSLSNIMKEKYVKNQTNYNVKLCRGFSKSQDKTCH